MHRIYVASIDSRAIPLSMVEHDLLTECRAVLEAEFPTCTFDSDTNHGVSGIRIHVEVYDLEALAVKTARDFARGWLHAKLS